MSMRCSWAGDVTDSLKVLDRFPDWRIRPQQIRPQIKSLDDFTPIKVEVKIEW